MLCEKEELYQSLKTKKYFDDTKLIDIKDLLGEVFINIETFINGEPSGRGQDVDRIIFETNNCYYIMTHNNSCCEIVYIKDISGDLQDLINCRIFKIQKSEL